MKQLTTNVLLAILLLAATAAKARQTELVEPEPQRVYASSGVPASAENLRQAVIRGAQTRGWRVVKVDGSIITLEIVVRQKHTLLVDVLIDQGSYQVRYRDSDNLEYEQRDGARFIHPNVLRWMEYLQLSINSEIQ